MTSARRKWRPSLGQVLGGALAGTLAVACLGLWGFQHLAPIYGESKTALILATLIALSTAIPGWLLVRLLLRPIRALETFAQAMGASPVPDHFGTRETHATAERVIEMTRALQDREATVRAFTDHVTHELKTPVAAIRAAVELMQDGGALTPEDARLLAEIDGARVQLETQLTALRRTAQAREARYLGTTTLSAITPALQATHPALVLQLTGADLPLPMSTEGLHVILGQLVRNAVEHEATKVTLAAVTRTGGVEIIVSDNGHGISDGNAARVFEPFFTTRRDHGGTGMGLAIVSTILASHHGGITVLSAPKGASFRLWLTAPHLI